MRLEDTLRLAARQSGLGVRALARALGVDPALVSRFLKGECGLSIRRACDLAELLGLELMPKRQGKTKGGRSRGVDQH